MRAAILTVLGLGIRAARMLADSSLNVSDG